MPLSSRLNPHPSSSNSRFNRGRVVGGRVNLGVGDIPLKETMVMVNAALRNKGAVVDEANGEDNHCLLVKLLLYINFKLVTFRMSAFQYNGGSVLAMAGKGTSFFETRRHNSE